MKTLNLMVLAALVPATLLPVATMAKSVCIPTRSIDHTETPDDSTIIFYMRDHKVFKNTLTDKCFGLHNNFNGFTYVLTPGDTDRICSNLLTIKVNDTGSVCPLGEFTQIAPVAPLAQ